MSLQFDQSTGKITYRDTLVGEHIIRDGRNIVRLNLEYEGSGDDWIVPLSWFAHGLSFIEERPARALLTVKTSGDCIKEEYDVLRFLTEKQVKRKNFVWDFHKNDADDWPSRLHGHDYDKGLKLDAITGKIYDVGTRTLCKTMKKRDLKYVQAELKASKDFKELAKKLIPKK